MLSKWVRQLGEMFTRKLSVHSVKGDFFLFTVSANMSILQGTKMINCDALR